MNKAFFIAGFVALILLASCGTKSDNYSASDYVAPTQNTTQTNEVAVAGELASTTELGTNYTEYDASLLSGSDNNILFFHASYCGSCRATDESLKGSGVTEGSQVLKLDFDTATDLRKKYGVTKYHTFVQVDSEGNMIKKWSGSMSNDDIQENLTQAMMDKTEDLMDSEDAMMKKDEDSMEKMENTMMDKTEDLMDSEDAMMKKDELKTEEVMMKKELAGVYADYNESLVGKTDTTVIAFFASWCPSCVSADKAISAGELPDGLTVLKADFDSQTDLRKKYGVVGQHTFVQVDADGNEIKKWLGGNSVQSITEKLQ